MDNHYHLIMEAQGVPIGAVMQRINQAYSVFFNQKYKCTGAVFGTRYHLFSVSDMPYLRQLLQYIAYNPVKAGIVKDPTEYRWSAHLEVASFRSQLVSTNRLFEILGGTVEKGARTYDILIRHNISALSKAPTIKAFDKEYRISQLRILLEEILDGRMTVESIQSGRRDTNAVQLRSKFTQIAYENGYSPSEIAGLLQVTERYIRKTLPRSSPLRPSPPAITHPNDMSFCGGGHQAGN